MAVFDATQGQVLISPVTEYYRGNAMRQAEADAKQEAELRRLEINSAKMELANAPALQAAANEKLRLDRDKAEQDIEKGIADLGYERMKRRSDALRPVVTEAEKMFKAGDQEGAANYLAESVTAALQDVDPEAAAQMNEMAGPDHVWQPEELKRLKNRVEAFGAIEKEQDKSQHQQHIEALVKSGHISQEEGDEILRKIEVKAGTITGTTEHDPKSIFGDSPGDNVSARLANEIVNSSENLLSSLGRIEEQIDSTTQSSLGLPGTISAVVDNGVNAAVGLAEMFGGTAQLGDETVSERILLNANLYKDMFEGPAASNAAIQSNAVGVAYALARASNPDGRISDADVKHQLKRLNLSVSSKAQMKAAIKEVRRETMRSVANHLRQQSYTETEKGLAIYDKYMKELDKLDNPSSATTGVTDAPKTLPKIGEVIGDRAYVGGDPNEERSWQKKP